MFTQSGRCGKASVKTFSNLFLKTLTEGAVTTEARSFIPVFHNPRQKHRSSSLPMMALTLGYLVGVPSKAASNGREEKQARSHIQ